MNSIMSLSSILMTFSDPLGSSLTARIIRRTFSEVKYSNPPFKNQISWRLELLVWRIVPFPAVGSVVGVSTRTVSTVSDRYPPSSIIPCSRVRAPLVRDVFSSCPLLGRGRQCGYLYIIIHTENSYMYLA